MTETYVHHCDYRELAKRVGQVDVLITDAPYSKRTHSGNDKVAGFKGRLGDGGDRLPHDYAGWSRAEVRRFVRCWLPRTSGWFCSITDHVLVPVWEDRLAWQERYVFAPLPCVVPGSRVRLLGDGPTCDTTQLVVARPRTKEYARWGTLPGHYVVPAERGLDRIGGKPLALMLAIVRDYSRPGDLICDPCAGGGTTLVAARMLGRRAIGCDIDEAVAKKANERVSRAREQMRMAWGAT